MTAIFSPAGLIEEFVLMPFKGQVDHSLQSLPELQSRRLPHLWIARDIGETGHSVQFVDNQFLRVVSEEEINPGQASAID